MTGGYQAARFVKKTKMREPKNMRKKKENQQQVNANCTRLIKKYRKYASTKDAFAVEFAKRYVKQASGRFWVHIIKANAPKGYDYREFQFERVVFELFPKTIRPTYPKRSECESEEQCQEARKAIEWDASTKDIKQQRKAGVKGKLFVIRGELVKKKGRRPKMFVESAPRIIRELELDPKNKTSPLWAKAIQYINPEYLEYEEYKYRIVHIKEVKN